MAAATSIDFTVLEDAIAHIEAASDAWNVQLEVASSGRLDEQRLRAAVAHACARHPLARVRRREGWAGTDLSFTWEIPEEPDDDPVRVVDVGEADLDEVRSALYSPHLPLESSPPLRIVLARRAHGDLFLLNASHVALDGIGTVRVAQSIARAYRGADDPADPVPLAAARDVDGILRPGGLQELLARTLDNASRALAALEPPARIAVVGGSADPGFGFVHRRLPAGRTAELLDRRPPGTTFNDVLLGALGIAIERWNEEHGEPAGRIALMMPVNGRPRDWYWDVAGMYVLLTTVSTMPPDRRDLATAAKAVAAQTAGLKREGRAAGLFDLLRLGEAMPVGVKRAMPLLLPLTGNRFIDTAVLSNLGRLPDPPHFEDAEPGAPPELWFSPPCRMPLGVGVGAATVDGVLHLVVRHHFGQFDRAAAAEFTDVFLDALGAT